MTAPPNRSTATGGVVAGLWPQAPDAPLVVPVPGSPKLPWATFRKLDVRQEELRLALWIGRDRIYCTPMRDGVPMCPPNHDARVPGMALIGVHAVQPGVLSGLSGPLEVDVDAAAQNYAESYLLDNGPAVRLGLRQDIYIPTSDPAALAAEIERRRQRALRLGGYGFRHVDEIPPFLRNEAGAPYGSGNPPPGVPHGAEWQPLQPAQLGELGPPGVAVTRTPPTSVPYPETKTAGELSLTLRGSLPLWLTVSNRRLSLSQQVLPQSSPVHLEPRLPEPHAHIGIPLARFALVRAGRLAGLPGGWHQAQLAPDTHTEIRLDMVDGPAVWLWGPTDEFVICHPEAERLAADIRLRQQVGLLYPVAADFGAERETWRNFFTLAPVDGPQGRALPAPPPYAPVEPTLVPPDTWTPAE